MGVNASFEMFQLVWSLQEIWQMT